VGVRAQYVVHPFGELRVRGDELHANTDAGKRFNNTRQRTVFSASHLESQLDAGIAGQVHRSPHRDEAASLADVANLSAKQVAGPVGHALCEAGATDSYTAPSFMARLALCVLSRWLDHPSALRRYEQLRRTSSAESAEKAPGLNCAGLHESDFV